VSKIITRGCAALSVILEIPYLVCCIFWALSLAERSRPKARSAAGKKQQRRRRLAGLASGQDKSKGEERERCHKGDYTHGI
jgi:hypothetical protein